MPTEMLDAMVLHWTEAQEDAIERRACAVCRFVDFSWSEDSGPMIMKLTNPDGQSWTWRAVERNDHDREENTVRFRWPD